MAADNDYDKKRTRRFPCMVVVRYTVATVVSVLTFVFVAIVVISVELSDADEPRFSIVHGHVRASALWSEEDYGSSSCSGSDDCPTKVVTYRAASSAILWVTLSVYNPSVRYQSVQCHNISYRLLDMPNGPNDFIGMVEIVNDSAVPWSLKVSRRRSNMLTTWMPVDNSTVLSHLAKKYSGQTSFHAMVQVTATITPEKTMQQNIINQWCWPVTVGLDASSTAADVTCKRREEVIADVVPIWLAPAPAPAIYFSDDYA